MSSTQLQTWAADQATEDDMNHEHAPFWRRLIALMVERDLFGKSVLDFGCNQGGLLRALYHSHGYAEALGVDLASGSIARANALVGPVPARFEVRENLDGLEGKFDVALSQEVLYLLPDLDRHAREIYSSLKAGGVYYAAIGCHSDNPEWPRWRELIPPVSNLPVHSYSLDDFNRAFAGAGFEVYAQPFRIEEFVPLAQDGFMGGVAATLHYYHAVKTLFRCIKRA
ncbi:MAG: class I SAM-dependent methyltransferase [Pseudomonadota bacterium]